MYCSKCGCKLNDKDIYCSGCGNKINGGNSNIVKENTDKKGSDVLPLLFGISSLVTLFLLPVSLGLAIASIILGNKNNRENPDNVSNAPIILGIISIVLNIIFLFIIIMVSLVITSNKDNINSYINDGFDKIIEEMPNSDEGDGMGF